MNIERLQEFIVLASTCNYQISSETLYMTNSTLSKHISAMEKELGHLLFDRSTRKVTLTPAGKLFLESAKQIVSIYKQSLNTLDKVAAADGNTLNIAFLEVMRQYGVLHQIATFSKAHPSIDVQMMEVDAQYMGSLLHMNACDFAFASRLNFFGPEISAHIYTTDELVLVVPCDHPFAGKEYVRFEELQNETFVLHHSYYESDEFRRCCRENGFEPKVKFTSANSTNVFDIVANSMAISVLSRARCVNYAHFYSTMVRLEPTISFDIYMLFRKDRKFTPAMQTFYDYILNQPHTD